MQGRSLARLTDSQRACLLRVLAGATSKEIAPLLGLTFRTVDQYLHEAQQELGAPARREAARAFASKIDESELKRLQLTFPALADVSTLRQIPSSSETQERHRSAWDRAMGILRPPPLGGDTHDHLEIGRDHDLWQTDAKIVARSDADDDVMAMPHDGRYAIVHLTWNTNSGDGSWPHTRIFLTAQDAERAAFEGTRHSRE